MELTPEVLKSFTDELTKLSGGWAAAGKGLMGGIQSLGNAISKSTPLGKWGGNIARKAALAPGVANRGEAARTALGSFNRKVGLGAVGAGGLGLMGAGYALHGDGSSGGGTQNIYTGAR